MASWRQRWPTWQPSTNTDCSWAAKLSTTSRPSSPSSWPSTRSSWKTVWMPWCFDSEWTSIDRSSTACVDFLISCYVLPQHDFHWTTDLHLYSVRHGGDIDVTHPRMSLDILTLCGFMPLIVTQNLSTVQFVNLELWLYWCKIIQTVVLIICIRTLQ